MVSFSIMINYLLVGAGGFLGAMVRYFVSVWIGQQWGRSFPFGTLCVNVSGTFLTGLIMTIFFERLLVNPQWRLLLIIGFLGSYTTFSAFEYETGGLLNDGEWLLAFLNIFCSVIAGFFALKVGEVIARII